MMNWTKFVLIGAIALASAGCTSIVHTITADQWDLEGRSQYYLGYWEGNCMGAGGLCFSTKGKLMLCRLNNDNSLACSAQPSVTEALETKAPKPPK
ncbi:MAG: hypothetical protein EA397_03840 [Deltaproteobacteria bacterium]|nr:MAG: hypothetical protein EA397_03840 [Deltaproteobacteria bacterium]